MQTIYRCLTFIILLICLSSCHKAPDTIDSNNNPVYLSEYKDKWMVINYWATWCKPCLMELPELNAFHAQYGNKVAVLGVNFDGLPNTDIKHFADRLHLTFPLLSNFPGKKFGIDDISSLPVTFIINPQGKLFKTLYGPQTHKSLLSATLENKPSQHEK